eukprot:3840295-Prymnesium_polylepis.1
MALGRLSASPSPSLSYFEHAIRRPDAWDRSPCRMALGRSVNKKTSVFSSNDAVCRPEPWRFERRVTH